MQEAKESHPELVITFIGWGLLDYSLVTIKRNREWFATKTEEISKFWDNVVEHRELFKTNPNLFGNEKDENVKEKKKQAVNTQETELVTQSASDEEQENQDKNKKRKQIPNLGRDILVHKKIYTPKLAKKEFMDHKVFQKESLEEYFCKFKTIYENIIDILDLNETQTGDIGNMLLMLDFLREHEPLFVKQLPRPTYIPYNSSKTNLLTFNNALTKLQVFSKEGDDLMKFIDKTLTCAGKKKFRELFNSPSCVPEVLENRYDSVQHFIDNRNLLDEVKKHLKIRDLNRIYRRYAVGKIDVYVDMPRINEMNERINILMDIFKNTETVPSWMPENSVINDFQDYSENLKTVFNFENIKERGNVFNEGISVELDELWEELKKNDDELERVRKYLSGLIDAEVKKSRYQQDSRKKTFTNEDTSVLVQGGSLRTWSYRSPCICCSQCCIIAVPIAVARPVVRRRSSSRVERRCDVDEDDGARAAARERAARDVRDVAAERDARRLHEPGEDHGVRRGDVHHLQAPQLAAALVRVQEHAGLRVPRGPVGHVVEALRVLEGRAVGLRAEGRAHAELPARQPVVLLTRVAPAELALRDGALVAVDVAHGLGVGHGAAGLVGLEHATEAGDDGQVSRDARDDGRRAAAGRLHRRAQMAHDGAVGRGDHVLVHLDGQRVVGEVLAQPVVVERVELAPALDAVGPGGGPEVHAALLVEHVPLLDQHPVRGRRREADALADRVHVCSLRAPRGVHEVEQVVEDHGVHGVVRRREPAAHGVRVIGARVQPRDVVAVRQRLVLARGARAVEQVGGGPAAPRLERRLEGLERLEVVLALDPKLAQANQTESVEGLHCDVRLVEDAESFQFKYKNPVHTNNHILFMVGSVFKVPFHYIIPTFIIFIILIFTIILRRMYFVINYFSVDSLKFSQSYSNSHSCLSALNQAYSLMDLTVSTKLTLCAIRKISVRTSSGNTSRRVGDIKIPNCLKFPKQTHCYPLKQLQDYTFNGLVGLCEKSRPIVQPSGPQTAEAAAGCHTLTRVQGAPFCVPPRLSRH
ncbi:hypothetical protein AURANDRAFT_68074 [Aureococcus anophagefferens]|uniref:DNA mismatch repair protein MutS core domain-containing protein n=1 Tax=Aureococcus anophagefferens TaxID=44056 RepID=F0YNE5_AURAN|nr:hypothetical protein AURANDRAFT_68074 [Aureococcus anophagefferens]EGB03369.1 hypothetical protein AURANDRAFT_68074 [Aureococcus anophagefferens]|eukprot:XP_009041942.1 hypothetical protein AURANDRAFT_68074 [Aureococcus anophagefferens]